MTGTDFSSIGLTSQPRLLCRWSSNALYVVRILSTVLSLGKGRVAFPTCAQDRLDKSRHSSSFSPSTVKRWQGRWQEGAASGWASAVSCTAPARGPSPSSPERAAARLGAAFRTSRAPSRWTDARCFSALLRRWSRCRTLRRRREIVSVHGELLLSTGLRLADLFVDPYQIPLHHVPPLVSPPSLVLFCS